MENKEKRIKIRRNKLSSKLQKVFKNRQKKTLVTKKTIKKSGWLKKLFYIGLVLLFLSVGAFLVWVSTLEIPNINQLQNIKISQATKIYDRTGKVVLYNIYEDERRTIVTLDKISKKIQDATVAIEDEDFYVHNGTQVWRILGSIYHNVVDGHRLRGASTITQQVIKQTLLNSNREISRKIKELILSFRFEVLKEEELGSKKAAKDSILEMYLNENPYGGTIYGVEEAATFYFGKHASEVTQAEAAYLAAMPQAPTTYSPYGKHKDALNRRKNLVLSRLLSQGYITLKEYKDAKNEKVEFVFRKKNLGLKAPHFVMYVRKELEKMYSPSELKSGGLKVYTTLDFELQEKIQSIVKKNIDELVEKKLGANNGSVVVISPKTGEILTMVGSKDYFAEDIDGKFNVATAKRQPGSTFKPFAYLTAFQNGYTPKTVLWDVKTEFSDACDVDFKKNGIESKLCYHPNNFDFKFKGHILMEEALPQSRNIPAIKTLYLAGLNNTFKNIKSMGIESLNKSANHYGLSLVLGAGEVKLLNLTSAYGVLANEGEKIKKRSILRVEDSKGKIIFETKKENERVISKRVSLIMSRILSDNKLKYPTFGLNSPLYFKNRQVASKTGTTNDNKDFWTVGYDAGNIALGVWVGNNNNKPAKGKANYYAKKIWKDSMVAALEGEVNENFEKVEEDYSSLSPVLRGVWQGNIVVRVDVSTGSLANEDTPDEFIKEIPISSYHSILNWVKVNSPRDGTPTVKDRAFDRWEYGVQAWTNSNSGVLLDDFNKNIQDLLNITGINNGVEESTVEEGDNENLSNTTTSSNVIDFKVLSPGSGDTFRESENLYINISDNGFNIKKYLIHINNKYIAATGNGKLNISLSGVSGLKKENTLSITAIESDGKKTVKNIIFNLR